jgi:hypothetical protein
MLWIMMLVTCFWMHKELWNHIQGEFTIKFEFLENGLKLETWDLRSYYGQVVTTLMS